MLSRLLILLLLGFAAASMGAEDQAASAVKLLAKEPMNRNFLDVLKRQALKVEDADERSRYLIMYFYGLLTHKDAKAAGEARKYIVQRHSNSPHLPTLRYDDLKTACTDCQGGKQKFTCTTCAGRNYCKACNGQGQVRTGLTGKRRVCPECMGKRRCIHCNNFGKQEKNCSTCRGSQQILPYAAIKKRYLGLIGAD